MMFLKADLDNYIILVYNSMNQREMTVILIQFAEGLNALILVLI